MQGPDTPGQAAGTEQSPLSLGRGLVYRVQAFSHAQGGEAASASDQQGKRHQIGVVPALKKDLTAYRQLGEHL
ncbi:hypothetical protein D3C80_1932810 [compost metagenome]